jgi:hypothetical protein
MERGGSCFRFGPGNGCEYSRPGRHDSQIQPAAKLEPKPEEHTRGQERKRDIGFSSPRFRGTDGEVRIPKPAGQTDMTM